MGQTARRLHELDPTRPVAADLWGRMLPPRAGGGMFGRARRDRRDGLHRLVRGAGPRQGGPAARKSVRRAWTTCAACSRTSRSWSPRSGRPARRVAGSAFGGLSFQAAVLARRLRELIDDPDVSGTIVWTLRDYALRPDFRGGSVLQERPGLTLTPGLNEKGLYDFAGKPKPSLASVRDVFASASEGELRRRPRRRRRPRSSRRRAGPRRSARRPS